MADMLTMPCPLCAATLADRDTKGRFHCATCSPTSEESRRGWLPRSLRTTPKTSTAAMARALGQDPMFSVDAKGDQITRGATCECGTTFTQRLLSEYFLTLAEGKSAAAIGMVTRQIPGYFVPVHCPRCERIDIARQAWVDGLNAGPNERDHAAD